MKTMTRKCGIFAALAAVLLMFTLLITNCMDDLSYSAEGSNPVTVSGGGTSQKTGTGSITLSIGAPGGRSTIIPTDLSIGEYEVTVSSGATTIAQGAVLFSGGTTLTGTFEDVLAGTGYTVTVVGYKTDIVTDDPIAMGVATGVDVVDTVGGTADVTNFALFSVNPDPGDFSYDFSTALTTAALTGPDTATLNFTVLGGVGSAPSPVNLLTTGNDADTISLDYGCYYVSVVVAKSNHYAYEEGRVLYIYQNLESEWVINSFSLIPISQRTVLFDVTTNGGTTNPGSQTVAHGSTLTNPTGFSPPAGEYLKGWFVNGASDTSFQWVFGNGGTKVYSSRTLYAIFITAQVGDLVIEIPELEIDTVPITVSGGTKNISDFELAAPSPILNITVSNVSTDSLTNFVWTYASSGDLNSFWNAGTGILELDFSSASIPAGLTDEGTHSINVQAQSGGKYWSANIAIVIAP